MKREDVYIKDKQSALINKCGQFIYEVLVYVRFENIFNLANHQLFSSDKEIKNIVSPVYISPHIEIQCYLYSAPKRWLIDNNFILYVKPEKKKRILKNKENEQKIIPVEYTRRGSSS